MYRLFFKRFLDILLSICFLPFILILIVIIGVLIGLFDKWPLFYCAPRMGKNGEIFNMIKFRSMKVNSPDLRNADGSTFNAQNDQRVTFIGYFLRKTSIDELPQIINVLKGDMSFIGPRPSLTTTPYTSYSEIRKKRVSIRPGVTGYSQAYFRNSISQDEKFKCDCEYVDKMSLAFDLKVLCRTFIGVLRRDNIY